ncbi:ABC transporter permease [Sphaerobacter thermophilus]|uniref:Binding-protein-dependent transport systems inner membrane component n=1 Tax=Sphaerobacter thermophilus (strain ATCC 49802 / DSM 20745 / KCCM 41009 / NCIMB 13125 / S 6022) TaxID=479434 RepID=D1C491_SPHTD|nr:ABC transporter permease [Sphaerobacter thermophilus]ACZ39058.1 binding-protein-dependent transport systems inner membrane component [Sphaerobacter thermophilus DSM 20745]
MQSTHEQSAAAVDKLSGNARPQRSEFSRIWRRFRRHRLGLAGLTFIGLLVVTALLADLLAPYSPIQSVSGMRGVGPSWSHPLGFDHIGRDILSRIIFGTRIALIVGIGATGIAVTIGVLVGATAGYFGGWVDNLLSRAVDTLMAFPTLVLLIALTAVVGPSLRTVVIVIGATVWAQYARVVRADTMSLRERDFTLAARVAGATNARIIFRHLVPNVLGPVIVLASLAVGGIIIYESTLSFLGLGIQPPEPSWGGMLADGRAYIVHYPHIAIAPGVMITLTVLAFNLLGDGLRDALDPRTRD